MRGLFAKAAAASFGLSLPSRFRSTPSEQTWPHLWLSPLASYTPRGGARQSTAFPWKRQRLFLNQPWASIARVLLKIHEDGDHGVLVLPLCPSQARWPLVLRLRARWVRLPPPRACVLPLHGGPVEPFSHFTTRTVALVFDATNGWKASTLIFRRHS